MHEDLRRRALESKKTTSRKSRAKQNSAPGSRSNSRSRPSSVQGSQPNSRTNSPSPPRSNSDDDDNHSDTTAWSVASLDNSGEDEDSGASQPGWEARLSECSGRLLNRKGHNQQAREDDLMLFANILRANYAYDQIRNQFQDLLSSLMRSVKSGNSHSEITLALRALQVLAITLAPAAIYDKGQATFKDLAITSDSKPVKVEALRTLGIVTCLNVGPGEEPDDDVMAFFLEVVESDGEYLNQRDGAEVVTCALEMYTILCTQVEDMESTNDEAMEVLVDQLNSGSPAVQIAAGEAIAILYAKSFGDAELDEEEDWHNRLGTPTKVQRYKPYRRQDLLMEKLEEIERTSSKSVSKKERKALHTTFADIRTSVDNPLRGPRKASLGRGNTRIRVKLQNDKLLDLDQWWKLVRFNTLKNVLQGGMLQHYEHNPVVSEIVPLTSYSPEEEKKSSSGRRIDIVDRRDLFNFAHDPESIWE